MSVTLAAPAAEEQRYWWHRVAETAPTLSGTERALVARFLANPRMTSDCLLILADALDEAARVAGVEGRDQLGAELLRLADLPRDQARVLQVLGRS